MKRVEQPSASNKQIGEVALARLRLAKAESQLKEAKEQARAAKHRRKEARQAARHAKQRVKNVKAEVAEANQALADAEQKLALAAKPTNVTRKGAKARRTANSPALKPRRLKKVKAPVSRRRTVLSASPRATAHKSMPSKSKPAAAAKAKVKRTVQSITVPPDRQEQPTANAFVPESEGTAAAIPTEPITMPQEEEADQKPPNEESSTPTIRPL